ncbi:MAG: imidazoleglycerol-phosphate dehydratase HisB [Magnetococcales bacterium]|nr:imidazoleglycerol-phosphate dehydratase HisB [Magnetococcales bacterium]
MIIRTATVERKTRETQVRAEVTLDGSGATGIQTGLGFLDHMLDQLGRHGLFDLTIRAEGDLHIDGHHTAEDVGIVLGQAFRQALGDRRGINRFGHAYVPLDEALSRVVVDLSNRPCLIWEVTFASPRLGSMETELFREWFMAFAHNVGMTLHVTSLYGHNDHHVIESCFKALARALRMACAPDPRLGDRVPSTKGTLNP